MKKDYQSYHSLFRDFAISLGSNLVLAALVGNFSGKPMVGYATFFVMSISVGAVIVVKKYRRLFKLIRSGATGYYFSFSLEENQDIFSAPMDSFLYMGISGSTIFEPLRKMLLSNSALKQCRLLLMAPDAQSLAQQIAYEKGIPVDEDLKTLRSPLHEKIELETKAERKKIEGLIETLKALPAYREGRLEIRLYDQFAPWWMYIIDGRSIYVGILQQGIRGTDCPVMMLKKVAGVTSGFDSFLNYWQSIWIKARLL